MATFKTISDNIRSINLMLLFQSFFLINGMSDFIIKLIQERLYDSGTTGDGIELETDRAGSFYPYSLYTVRIKQELSPKRPVDRVTLKQTGEFYDSIFVKINSDGFEINADFQKQDGHMFLNFKNTFPFVKKFEQSVLSLSEVEFKRIMKEFFQKELPKLINESIRVS